RTQPMTPWGKKSRGIKTRNSKASSEKLIIRHRKGNK
ncbi:MAG: 50S ribosomal protein L2, partial [Lactobacillus iners]|nr:50S ribosomal protein L2 [Lactobacillus iners]